jgi:hypothetical protein
MTVDELKIYFRGYLSGNYLKSIKMDIGMQINNLKDHIIRMFSLIDSVPKKNHYNNALSRACIGNLILVYDYLESL